MRLVAKGVVKSWGATHVLRGLDLEAEPGTLTAIIGGNGAGKSTLIRILATILRPDAGSITLGEFKLPQARALIGYLGHESMLDAALTMRENLQLFGRLYGVPDVQARAAALIERFDAAHFADNPLTELSRGQEQAAALCRALIHNPRLLLLDEPSTGLDEQARARLWQAAQQQAADGAIVLFSTHDHDSARSVANRVLEVSQGKLTQR
jgi:ABC-type multidrug transport system ATPase subunit